ncbi:CocE/NonD family hydrolase C-terminal non-catalytic domain-containing protein [Micromonospora sp. BRA006-A]|nr:CocE/NonD family hydrolase C-terminal non-catalytic domain-containing protein [Micromonospora sp. BRA006-A]
MASAIRRRAGPAAAGARRTGPDLVRPGRPHPVARWPAAGGPPGRRGGQPAGRGAPDVLTYTSEPLRDPVEVAGPVAAEIHLRSELSYLDVFVRLCDVDRRGRSWNVCDGLVRVEPGRFPRDPSGVVTVPVTLWPTAYRFAPGTGCACRSPAAPTRATRATPAPVSRSAPL